MAGKLAALSLLAVLLGCATATSDVSPSENDNEILSSKDNYVITDKLADGEVERRVKFHGVTAKETAVALKPDGKPVGIKLWQVAEGKKFIQLIYDIDGKLVDCEYVHDGNSAKEFVEKFDSESEVYVDKYHLKDGNVTVRHVRLLTDMDDAIREITNYRRLRRSCKRLHRYVRKFSQEANVGHANVTSHDDDEAERNSRTRRETSDPTPVPVTSSSASPTKVTIMPGTKWCGSGSVAGEWTDVGSYAGADLCCRNHDHCPFKVNGLATNYGYFNYRLFTVSHCDCDERFRTCLKMTNSAASNMVGKIFFNIIQTKCFVLKPEKTCMKRSWWGKCLKEGLEKKAHMRDSLKY